MPESGSCAPHKARIFSMTVEEELRRFRGEFKDYGRVFEQIWSALTEDCAPDHGLLASEERLRE